MSGEPVDGDRVGDPGQEPLAQRALVRDDRLKAADRLQVGDRRVEPGQKLVGRGAGGEPATERMVRRRAHLVRAPGLEHRGAAVGDAHVRPAELVRRAEQNVGIDRANVDRLVGGVVDGIDPGQRADGMRELTHTPSIDDRAHRIRRPGERDHAGPLGQLGLQVVVVERGVVVQPDVANDQVLVVRELKPRRHAAVVIQRGDEDLVPGLERAPRRPRQREVQRRHVRPEDAPRAARSRGTTPHWPRPARGSP